MKLETVRVNIQPAYTHDDPSVTPLWEDLVIVTDEIKAAAAARLVEIKAAYVFAKNLADRLHMQGAGQWDTNGGRSAYKRQLALDNQRAQLELLADGGNQSGWCGYMTEPIVRKLLGIE